MHFPENVFTINNIRSGAYLPDKNFLFPKIKNKFLSGGNQCNRKFPGRIVIE